MRAAAGAEEGSGGETDFLPVRPPLPLSPSYSDLSTDFRQSQIQIANTTTPHLSLALAEKRGRREAIQEG